MTGPRAADRRGRRIWRATIDAVAAQVEPCCPHRDGRRTARLVVAGGWARGRGRAGRQGQAPRPVRDAVGRLCRRPRRRAPRRRGRRPLGSVAGSPDPDGHATELSRWPSRCSRLAASSRASAACRRCAAPTSRSTRSEVVALVGDNGAGKSTLVKSLAGVHPPDSGRDPLRGPPGADQHAARARALGIETVYQDLALARGPRPGRQPVPGPRDPAPRPARQARLPGQGRDAPPRRRGVRRPRRRHARTRARRWPTCPAASARASRSAAR